MIFSNINQQEIQISRLIRALLSFQIFSCLNHNKRLKQVITKYKQNKFIRMSIYSGFATRHLQQTYDQYVCDMLFVLQKRIIKFYQNSEADQDKFWSIFSQLYYQIIHLEKCKYLEPKSSVFINQIFEYLKAKKIQRQQDPEEDLKHFERSMAVKIKSDADSLKLKEVQVNNFIRRSSFSFGKIKRQLDAGRSINISRQTKNHADSFNNSFEMKESAKIANPEEKKTFKQKRIFSSKGIRNAKSLHEQTGQKFQYATKVKGLARHPAQEIVKQYLQKTNKNYLKGYRKRKIKEEFGMLHATDQISKIGLKEKLSGR